MTGTEHMTDEEWGERMMGEVAKAMRIIAVRALIISTGGKPFTADDYRRSYEEVHKQLFDKRVPLWDERTTPEAHLASIPDMVIQTAPGVWDVIESK